MHIPAPDIRMISWFCIRQLTLIAFFYFFAGNTYAAQTFIGASTHWALLKGQDEATKNDVEELSRDKELELSLSVKSLDNYFSDSSFGVYLEFGVDSYAVERPVVTAKGESLVTRLSGDYWLLAPTIFYNFGQKNPARWSFKAGVGLGLGYLSGDGTIMIGGPLTLKSIDGKDYNVTFGFLIEYEYKSWVIRVKEYAPRANIDGIDFKIELPTVIVGYRFDL